MYTINTIPRVKCWLTVFTHSLFLYQKYHSFAALTRCKYRMPALSMKYSPYVLFGKSIENETPSQSIQSSRTNATPSSGTSPLASKEVTPLPPPLPLWEFNFLQCFVRLYPGFYRNAPVERERKKLAVFY